MSTKKGLLYLEKPERCPGGSETILALPDDRVVFSFCLFPRQVYCWSIASAPAPLSLFKTSPPVSGSEKEDLAPRIALVSPGQGEPHPHLVRVGVTGRRSRAALSGMSETCFEL
ncbi:hypothetical protein CEXT_533331 [Caerostris extrusa]|uniref:Uncharacterized protein n=1 Tax=Caerostris extrusa TaxID=172846 RepID=A0AAV4PPV7_CAEEX|nr:hypothetical protein CEXT_533331 [Caerostris extrusa]